MNCFKNDFEQVPLVDLEDNRHRRSPIPSRGIEVKLSLSFKSSGEIVNKIKQLIREDLNI